MDIEFYKQICYSLGKAFTTGVRLYQKDTLLYYFSLYCVEPDPVEPFLHQITESGQDVGVITTALDQFYGFLTLESGIRIILGPTCVLKNDKNEWNELLNELQIEPEQRDGYIRKLKSAPVINIDRFVWLLVSMMTVLQGRIFSVDKVWIESPPQSSLESVRMEEIGNRMNNMEDMGVSQSVRQSVSWEQLVSSYVEEGKTKQLQNLFTAPPKIYLGNTSDDGVWQMKNWGTCMAYSMMKAAIRGGLDPQQSFYLTGSFIRNMEFMRDIPSLERLVQEMIIDFSEKVEKLKYSSKEGSTFSHMCVQYISHHIYSTIRLEDMARELGYSRPYLCSRFKKEMNLSLTQYIHQEKVEEAKRLLEFSEYDLSEIASMLHFSSQSHFQKVFKEVTGSTPMAYRTEIKDIYR